MVITSYSINYTDLFYFVNKFFRKFFAPEKNFWYNNNVRKKQTSLLSIPLNFTFPFLGRKGPVCPGLFLPGAVSGD